MSKLCFVDTETTGTDFKKHGLVQISGIVLVDGVEKSSFNYHPHPFDTDEIDDSALAVNGVKREDFALFDKPKDIHDALSELLGDDVDKFDKRDKYFFVGYNARFDADFVRAFFEKCGDVYFGSWFYFPPIDVMNLAAARLMDKRSQMPNFKLATVAGMFDLKPEGDLHDAFTDIRLTKRLFDKLTNQEDK